ncbi:MAG: hypothetical protein RL720_634 [Actinomycetota bacterium]
MAKSTPASFDPAEEKPTTRKAATQAPKVEAPQVAGTQTTYPGQTLGIVALVFSFFFQIPALAMGITAWVWSHKNGKNNLPAKISVYVSGALIVIGTFFFAIWIALVGSVVGGFDRGHDGRGFGGFEGGPMPVEIMPGQMPGGMDDMMHGFDDEFDGQQGGRTMPAPSDLPSATATTN